MSSSLPSPFLLDRRPIVVAVAGPNGAGKTSFYYAHLQPAGLRLVNADVIARELRIDPYDASICPVSSFSKSDAVCSSRR